MSLFWLGQTYEIIFHRNIPKHSIFTSQCFFSWFCAPISLFILLLFIYRIWRTHTFENKSYFKKPFSSHTEKKWHVSSVHSNNNQCVHSNNTILQTFSMFYIPSPLFILLLFICMNPQSMWQYLSSSVYLYIYTYILQNWSVSVIFIKTPICKFILGYLDNARRDIYRF